MNIGSVPYLNALPLIASLEEEPRLEVPAALVRLLKIDELDIALAPIACLFDHPEWKIIDGIGLGTKGAIRSVKLSFNKSSITIYNIKSIYTGIESVSSLLLLKVLLVKKYGRRLDEISMTGPIPGGDEEAQLVIGDKALKENSPYSIDLGLEWTSWTRLPFVFAGWISRSSTVDASIIRKLKNCRDRSLKNLETIIPITREFSTAFLKEYFTENLSYELGEAEKKGIVLFHRYAAELGLAAKGWEPHFIV